MILCYERIMLIIFIRTESETSLFDDSISNSSELKDRVQVIFTLVQSKNCRKQKLRSMNMSKDSRASWFHGLLPSIFVLFSLSTFVVFRRVLLSNKVWRTRFYQPLEDVKVYFFKTMLIFHDCRKYTTPQVFGS